MKRKIKLRFASELLSKDCNRITGRIAASLALNSPWIQIVESFYNQPLMKKTKTVTLLKGFSVAYSDEAILEKPLKIGRNLVRFKDLFPNFSGKANFKITVECIPTFQKRLKKASKNRRK